MSTNQNKKNYKEAFSLIEVLIFISVITLFFIVSISVTTVSLRNMKINEHKIKATHYAEELGEWLRSYKEIDWLGFSQKVDNISCNATIYCFNILSNDFTDPNIWPDQGACSTNGLDPAIYKREVTLEPEFALGGHCGDTLTQVRVSIHTKWSELNNNYDIPLTTILSVWEK